MRVLPFYQQPEGTRACGAACLCMVYKQLGLDCDLMEIFRDVAEPFGPELSCRCNKMILNALSHGLIAYCVSCNDLKHAIQTFLDFGYEVIALIHPRDTSLAGHFITVSYMDGDKIYFNDPEKRKSAGLNSSMRSLIFARRAKNLGREDEITTSNTLLLFRKGPPPDMDLDPNAKLFPIDRRIAGEISWILDPYSDKWQPR